MLTQTGLPDKDNIFKVSDINLHIKHILESNLTNLYIEGEIANFTHHNSGHIYFSLKDEKSTIKCVFFKGYNRYLSFKPKVGDNVICLGKITVYERGGNYQLNVLKMIPSGRGSLELKFEELKKKLKEEGLFDEAQKKALPKYPKIIGIVTSETGAAIRDIENIIARRFPCRMILYPAIVQGETAPGTVIKGIKYFNNRSDIDLIIIGRGGGSQEDLFCFNDENLAREIFASEIPVISAVGHEIDFTIADFVADLRAPTPSAAAELAVPDRDDISRSLQSINQRILSFINSKVFTYKLFLANMTNNIQAYKPENLIRSYQQTIDESEIKLNHLIRKRIDREKQRVDLLGAKISTLSPYNALQRGYSLIRKEQRIINSINNLTLNDKIEVTMSDGSINCTINEIEKNS